MSYKMELDLGDCFGREKMSYKMDLELFDCFERGINVLQDGAGSLKLF